MKRRPGLQDKWGHVVDSLQRIIPAYERGSRAISLFSDRRMRDEAASFAVSEGEMVLDLGAGPGAMSKLVEERGGRPVLLDVSRDMLSASSFVNRVQGTFEDLPFKDCAFDAVVSGFAVRDSRDLLQALSEVARVVKRGGKFGFCDLGRPNAPLKDIAVAFYMRVAPSVIGLITAGSQGLMFGSLFDTYVLLYHNSDLESLLSLRFQTELHETQLGGSVVFKCSKPR